MSDLEQPPDRRPVDAVQMQGVEQIVHAAWLSLPLPHRQLLELIGASQWRIMHEPLGRSVELYLSSAGHPSLDPLAVEDLDRALGVWVPDLRIVLIDAGHEKLAGLDESTYEAFIARIAWHEWGHALGIVRCSTDDIAAGERLLELAPLGIREVIRRAGYRRSEYTHELVAEVYALLIARHRRGGVGKPSWLNEEIYELVKRVTGWA